MDSGHEIPCVLGTSNNSVASSSQHCPFIFLSPPSRTALPPSPLPRALEPRNPGPDSPPSHARRLPAKRGEDSTRVCQFDSPPRRWFPQDLGLNCRHWRIENVKQASPKNQPVLTSSIWSQSPGGRGSWRGNLCSPSFFSLPFCSLPRWFHLVCCLGLLRGTGQSQTPPVGSSFPCQSVLNQARDLLGWPGPLEAYQRRFLGILANWIAFAKELGLIRGTGYALCGWGIEEFEK